MPARVKSCFEIDVARPLDVVADEQIEVAVVVVVEPGRRCSTGPPRRPHPRRRHVAELSSPIVAQQRVMPDRGDEEVDPTVVVVVAGGQAHPVGVERQSRRRRSVGEAAGAVVDEQRQGRGPGVAARGDHGHGRPVTTKTSRSPSLSTSAKPPPPPVVWAAASPLGARSRAGLRRSRSCRSRLRTPPQGRSGDPIARGRPRGD